MPGIMDAIIMKEGDFLNGRVLAKAFHIKTSYGEIEVKRKDVKHIHIKGPQFKKDELVTMDLNKFTGTLQEKTLQVKIQGGQTVEIPKGKIHTIMMITNS